MPLKPTTVPPPYQRFTRIDTRQILLHQAMRKEVAKLPDDLASEKKISIITATNKLVYMENIFQNFHRQSYPHTELIIILNNNQLDPGQWEEYHQERYNNQEIKIFQLDEKVTLGECLNHAVDHSTGDYIAKFDDDDYYAPQYLNDLIPCFSYTQAAVVGKAAQFIYFEGLHRLYHFNPYQGYRYNAVWGGTHVIKREVFEQVRFQPVNLAEDVHFNEDCTARGFLLYVADPFNYLRIRRLNKTLHTYKLDDDEYIKNGILLEGITNPREYISV